jgi:5-methylcytosine-specific restriction protein A
VAPPAELGYDTSWRKLSERARRIQPWCSDCGTDRDLTGDHSAEAWRRKAEGKPIRLQDVDVLCRGCNTKRGKQRPEPRGETPTGARPSCAVEAKTPLHTPGGYR